MKIFLVDHNKDICAAWGKYFGKCSNVEIHCSDFEGFMLGHIVDCVVSPGNSYGRMAGGLDKAIVDYFGPELETNVMEYIAHRFAGPAPVGEASAIAIPNNGITLIQCPTMLSPSPIKDPTIIKKCTVNTLKLAAQRNLRLIVMPGFGGSTGQVAPDVLAQQMYLGYKQVFGSQYEK